MADLSTVCAAIDFTTMSNESHRLSTWLTDMKECLEEFYSLVMVLKSLGSEDADIISAFHAKWDVVYEAAEDIAALFDKTFERTVTAAVFADIDDVRSVYSKNLYYKGIYYKNGSGVISAYINGLNSDGTMDYLVETYDYKTWDCSDETPTFTEHASKTAFKAAIPNLTHIAIVGDSTTGCYRCIIGKENLIGIIADAWGYLNDGATAQLEVSLLDEVDAELYKLITALASIKTLVGS